MTGPERAMVQHARANGDSDGDVRARIEKMRGLAPGTLKRIPPDHEGEDEDPAAQAHGPYGEGKRPSPDEPSTVPTSPENTGREDEPWKRPDSLAAPAPDAARNAEARKVQPGKGRPHLAVEDKDKLPDGQQVPPTAAVPSSAPRPAWLPHEGDTTP